MIEAKRPRGNPNWSKGMPSQNPSGRPTQTWQPPSQRAEYLTTKFKTHELIAFAKLIANGERVSQLSSQDAIVCIQLANIYQLRDGIERERMYDRLFGKVPDRTINLNLNLDVSPDQLSERATALLRKIAPMDIEQLDSEAVTLEDDSDLVDEPLVSEEDDSDLVQE